MENYVPSFGNVMPSRESPKKDNLKKVARRSNKQTIPRKEWQSLYQENHLLKQMNVKKDQSTIKDAYFGGKRAKQLTEKQDWNPDTKITRQPDAEIPKNIIRNEKPQPLKQKEA